MSNPLDPEMMSPAERLEEVASLMVRGFLRYHLRPVAIPCWRPGADGTQAKALQYRPAV